MNHYKLSDYSRLLADHELLESSCGSEDSIVEYLTYNSKQVIPGTLFICKGKYFKTDYLLEAQEKGALCYVSEQRYEESSLPCILTNNIRKAMPLLADLFNNSPWKDLTVIGVGGTKGKSTTAYYMKAIVDDYMKATGGKESAIISSIDTYDGKTKFESHITTPEAVELQEHFRNACDSGISFAEMEVSSQALKYDRVSNMRFDVGIFLNISEDHISPIEHKDFEDYFSSKLKIFSLSDAAVVNADMDFADRAIQEAQQCERTLTFSLNNSSADVYGYDVKKTDEGTSFKVRTTDFDEEFLLTMPGFFNVENALAVIAASLLIGIPKDYIHSGLRRARSSGRMEVFNSNDGHIVAVVDYAHNKLSFEKLFSSTRQEYPDFEIRAVFGCPGRKAYLRRRDLGIVAGNYSTKVYLTEEDAGNEPVEDISQEIARYVEEQGCPYAIINDRGEAIKTAIEEADGNTVLLVCGKGNETRQKRGNEYVDCISDVEYVKTYLDEYNRTHQ